MTPEELRDRAQRVLDNRAIDDDAQATKKVARLISSYIDNWIEKAVSEGKFEVCVFTWRDHEATRLGPLIYKKIGQHFSPLGFHVTRTSVSYMEEGTINSVVIDWRGR